MKSQRLLLLFGFGALIGCNGGGSTQPPPVTTGAKPIYELKASDPCAAKQPLPTDLFRDDQGKSEASACPGADPFDDDGAPLDSKLEVPIEGQLQASSLSSTASFTLGSTRAAGKLPPAVLLQKIGTATGSAGWKVVPVQATLADQTIELAPAAPLEGGSSYVLLITTSVRDANTHALGLAPIAKLLTGSQPIAAGAVEGLESDTAAKLERERLRLAPAVAILAASGAPPSKIAAIAGFGTALGFARMERLIASYQSAQSRFPFHVTTSGGDLRPEDVYPAGTPGSFFTHVRAFRKGTIRVPKLLDDAGHLRADWATNPAFTEVPFLASLPSSPASGYTTALLLPGFGRSHQDAREIANAMGNVPAAAVLAIDLAGDGDRTVNAATGMADLSDQASNNGNPEVNGPDGIPDHSGEASFSGEAFALRDGLLSSTIEVLHVIATLKSRTALVAEGIDPNPSDLHLIAHGQSAMPGVYAAAFSNDLITLTLPSGGAGIRELVGSGPMALKTAFLAKAPAGTTAANLDAYLSQLETKVLGGVSVEKAGALVAARYTSRVLLPHGSRAQLVPAPAQQRLIAALSLASDRISTHRPSCDDFFLYTCVLGADDPSWLDAARGQIAQFVSSGGVTVLPPP